MGEFGLNELTAKTLASQAGVNISTSWRWLEGHSRPSSLSLARLAQLGVVLQLPARPRPPKRQTKKRRRR